MQKIREALGVLGGIGLVIWPMLSLLACLFRGFKAGGAQGGLSEFQGWFCALTLIGLSAYYIAVAEADWSRRLLGIGVLLHGALFVDIIMLVSLTDGGLLIAPVIFVGPILWMIYAARIRESRSVA